MRLKPNVEYAGPRNPSLVSQPSLSTTTLSEKTEERKRTPSALVDTSFFS